MAAISIEEWALPNPADQIEDMRRRLLATRFPASACDEWTGGIHIDFLRRFAVFLARDYSWEADRARFGGRHLKVHVPGNDGTPLAVHVNFPLGLIAEAKPLVMLHGWPSSSFEFVHISEHLRDTGVMPVLVDLPGFGFSAPTPLPVGPRAIAKLVKETLVDGLGLRDLIVHGNDWGSTVASWLAIDHPELVRGIHVSMMGLKPKFVEGTPKPNEAESAWIKIVQRRLEQDSGYREIQATKPNTAAVGLADSPAALAGWIAEKFHGWNGGKAQGDPPVRLDDLAAIVTGYWLAGTISSANWIYAAVRAQDDTIAPVGGTGDVPVGFSLFANGFFPPPPESWARRIHRVVNYTVHSSGGHYPALTLPPTLAGDLLRFCNSIQ
jgi:pimeloyl-ACP methyl ester carboxylesterase